MEKKNNDIVSVTHKLFSSINKGVGMKREEKKWICSIADGEKFFFFLSHHNVRYPADVQGVHRADGL